ncbi:MAG: ATP-binding protein [Microcoleus vaginatus WJT46-NPBG5]|jgi:DNA replication protein DnaC|nr:ATP-binding protein [Microcoleus vaginatus WJT46-NPBG5]
MTLWQSFLIIEISQLYQLSRQEAKIILAKFPDEETTRTNNEVADRLTENSEVAIVPENVRRQMWTIYNERFRPKQNCEGFPDYNQQASPAKDTAFLNWLKQKYLEWLTTQDSAPSANADIIERPSCDILLNPFIPQNGRVDNPQQFFNRHREIQRVFELLNSNSSVALIGEEGIGKSSLLLEIGRQSKTRLSSPRQSVYIELLQGVNNDDQFYSVLCDKIDIPESKGYPLTRALQKHRLLLTIDNAGKMTREGFTRNLRDHLRGLAEGSDTPLRLILAVGEPLDQLFKDNQDESQTSPFHGLFQQEYIKPWDEVTVRAFIESRLKTTSVRFTEEEITQLVQESAGHPRRLMQLCYQTYARYMEQVQ